MRDEGHGRFGGLALVVVLVVGGCASLGGAPPQSLTLSDRSAASLSVKAMGKTGYRLTLSGAGAPSRSTVENRLAFEAAALTIRNRGRWFEAVAPVAGAGGWTPAADPQGRRYSFRMENWRPSWRSRGTDGWTSAAPDAATTEYQASIDVIIHGDRFDGLNPLGFEPYVLDDYLREQVAVAAR